METQRSMVANFTLKEFFVQQPPLLNLKCQCGYEEPIGVDVRSGVLIQGNITLVCPRCGNIHGLANATIMLAVSTLRETPRQP